MPFVRVRGIELYYELRGTGPRLLYISGTGADLRNRPNIFDSTLASEFEILAFDQRGLGQSSRPNIPYMMMDYAEDVSGLLHALSWSQCGVLGISFGGMVAQELAIQYPEKISRLVLCCTSSGGQGGSSYPFHELTGLSADDMRAKFSALNDTRHDEEWRQAYPVEFAAELALRKQQNAGEGEVNRAIGAWRQLEARIGHDTFSRLKQIKLPVLIAGGHFDGIAPKPNLEAINNQIKNSVLSFYEGGHNFYDTDPQAYRDVSRFLKTI